MTLRALGIALIWAGVAMLAGLLLRRFGRGAWSLEDEDVPPVSSGHKAWAVLALAIAAGGIGLVIWSIA
ncbi:MAG: hypothetical protein EPN20_03745 [Magnetospirillum sp.]|nr:MAG: hypothetical protein EPN20_03745 [Magnetospirillum sp.]